MTDKPGLKRIKKGLREISLRLFRLLLLGLPRLVLQQEGLVLAAVFVVVISLWGFVELADEVLEGNTQAFDHWVMRRLRRLDDPPQPIGPSWLVGAGKEITALGGLTVLTLFVLAVIGYLLGNAPSRRCG